jgi:hypothetical protein
MCLLGVFLKNFTILYENVIVHLGLVDYCFFAFFLLLLPCTYDVRFDVLMLASR